MILAPAIMTAEGDPKVAASKCLEAVGLDPDSYRCGFTKARSSVSVSILGMQFFPAFALFRLYPNPCACFALFCSQ